MVSPAQARRPRPPGPFAIVSSKLCPKPQNEAAVGGSKAKLSLPPPVFHCSCLSPPPEAVYALLPIHKEEGCQGYE